MFDLVKKYQTPIMWLCVVLMCGFGAFYLVADLFGAHGEQPEHEIGKFTIPGAGEVAITDRQFRDAVQGAQRLGLLESRTGDKTPPLARELNLTTDDGIEAVWGFLILSKLAKANGFATTDAAVVAEVNEAYRRTARPGDAPRELKYEDYAKNASEEMRAFWRDLSCAKRARQLLAAVDEITYAKLFDKYKTDYEELSGKYVMFDGSAIEVKLDPRASAEDRATLEKWFAEEGQRNVRAAKQIPEQGDFDVLYWRFKDVDSATLKNLYDTVWAPKAAEAGITIADADVEARFNAHRDDYQAAIDAAKGQDTRESRPTKSDLDYAKDRVRWELTVQKLAGVIYPQLSRPDVPLTFEQVTSLYGAKSATVTKMDADAIAKQADFGSVLAQGVVMGGFSGGKLKKGSLVNYEPADGGPKGPIDQPGGSISIWRVVEHRDSREPTLDDPGILDYAVEKYIEKKRQDEVKKQADEFKKAIDDKVAAAVKDDEAKADDEMKKAVDAAISAQGLSREKPEDRSKIVQIENQERVKRFEKIDAKKAEVEGKFFEEVAAEKKLKVVETGWMRRAVVRPAMFRPDDAKLPVEERVSRFYRKPARMTALGGLKKGRVGAVESEPQWAMAAVQMLVDRREPSAEGIWKLNETQLAQLKRAVSPAQPPAWNYEALKDPKWFGLNVPDLEKSKAEEAKRKASEEETKRKQDEKKKEQLRRKAATLIESTRDVTSPIKSGEDW